MTYAFPYRTVPAEAVRCDVWLLRDGTELPEALDAWDYDTVLDLTRTVAVDLPGIFEACQLPESTPLAIAVTWASDLTQLRGTAYRAPLTDGLQTINVSLTGEQLGGTLELSTRIVLSGGHGTVEPFVASLPGSVLWSDEHAIRLQGDAPLFPITVLDFASAGVGLDRRSGWRLSVEGDLDQATMGSLRLYVNEKHSRCVEALRHASAPDPTNAAILQAIRFDVARSLLDYALGNADFTDDAVFAAGSLGETLRTLFGVLFPGRTVEAIRNIHRNDASELSSQLQASLELFWM